MRRRDQASEDVTAKQPTRAVSPLDSRLDRKLSVDPEDLSRELALRGCTKTEFAGAPRPTLGDFPVLARIGRGGMGVVYFGVHPRLETEVAIKILPADMHARQPDLVRRFIREARIAARLSSDFLVRVYDVDRDKASGLYYLIKHGPDVLKPPHRVLMEISNKALRVAPMPLSALFYDAKGGTWVYEAVAPLTYVRHAIRIAYVEGEVAYLAEGPGDKTAIVTVGAPLLQGVEFKVGH